MKIKLISIALFSFAIVFSFQNCGRHLESQDTPNLTAVTPTYSSFTDSSNAVSLSLDVQPNELVAGSQVKWFGIFPTITLSHETIDPDRFKMLIKELRGRTNIVTVSYVSEQALSLAKSKGLVSQRNISAMQVVEEKIAAAESMGFKIAIELTPLFFNYNTATLKYDLSKLKDGYLQEWAAAVQMFKRHPSIIWYYPFDEPYWNAKGAGVSYTVMADYLHQMNTLIKRDIPNSKIVFIEAFAIIDENFTVPVESDYVGIDCYGNFDNCYGESIPSYYNKVAAKMTSNQKFIIIPDAFDFKAGDENGSWQNNVIAQSKKYLEYSRVNSRIEAIVLFLYNSPLDIGLNLERLSSTRQGSLLNLFYDQISLQNQSIIQNAPIVNPNINISYKDASSKVINIETTDQNTSITIEPVDFFDMSFSRPIVETSTLQCNLLDPDEKSYNCEQLMYRQSRYSISEIKKGTWKFQFKIDNGPTIERKVTVQAAVRQPTVLTISCPTNLSAGDSGTCTATDIPNQSLASGYWTVDGIKVNDSKKYSYTWNNIPAGTYKVQGFAKDIYGRDVKSNLLTVTVKQKALPAATVLTISCPVSLKAGDSGTCTATDVPSQSLASGYWTVDGVKVSDSNKYSYTWSNIPSGTYKIQGFAKDNSGRDVKSNIVTVIVAKPTLTISCPTNVAAGSSPTCSAVAQGKLSSGYWLVNNEKVAGSDDQLNFKFNNVPAGAYRVQGFAKDSFGNSIYSNILNITVRP